MKKTILKRVMPFLLCFMIIFSAFSFMLIKEPIKKVNAVTPEAVIAAIGLTPQQWVAVGTVLVLAGVYVATNEDLQKMISNFHVYMTLTQPVVYQTFLQTLELSNEMWTYAKSWVHNIWTGYTMYNIGEQVWLNKDVHDSTPMIDDNIDLTPSNYELLQPKTKIYTSFSGFQIEYGGLAGNGSPGNPYNWAYMQITDTVNTLRIEYHLSSTASTVCGLQLYEPYILSNGLYFPMVAKTIYHDWGVFPIQTILLHTGTSYLHVYLNGTEITAEIQPDGYFHYLNSIGQDMGQVLIYGVENLNQLLYHLFVYDTTIYQENVYLENVMVYPEVSDTVPDIDVYPETDDVLVDALPADIAIEYTDVMNPTIDPPTGGFNIPGAVIPPNLNIKDRFPFCLPFDLIRLYNVLEADPVTPSWTVDWSTINFRAIPNSIKQHLKFTINLSAFDGLAAIVRWFIWGAFCIFLIWSTSKLVKY